ncbi:MAG: DNA gyrase inhibitor YacG [Rhodobacteraceae bacterium]|nr:DNA gyrase inhibitor YacG [Paracoccaceae bacterium]
MNDKPDPESTRSKPDEVRVSSAKCVRCGQPVQARYRPFCSQRCADADLGAWFKGNYRIAAHEEPDPGELSTGEPPENQS